MKKMLLVIFLLIMVLSACNLGTDNNEYIVINEICSSNSSTLATEDYKYYDWIELYNPSEENVNLRNYGISDKEDKLYRYKFPSTVIKSKEYFIVYFEKDYTGKDKYIADFGLSDTGETIYLTMPNGKTIDKVELPSLREDTTYGRYNSEFKVLNPSPNKANETVAIYKYIEAPSFSNESGFYDSSFNLSLSTNSEAKIYYTIDSSTPTDKSNLYDDSIIVEDPTKNPNVLKSRTDTSSRGYSTTTPVDKGFVVRAVAISDDGNKSDVVTKTYFIGKSKYKNKNVLSLVTDSENLVDENTGIYVTGKAYNDYVAGGKKGEEPLCNWDQTGREWERNANFSLIEKGNFNFSQNVGIRIHGYGGRTTQIKSLNVYARNCYEQEGFKDPIFEDTKYTNSLVLKYDRYSNSSEKYRDGFLQSLMSEENVDYQKYEMCVLFLNGEYWETYMIMQKYTDDYIEEKYDIPTDDVVMIKEGALEEGTEEDLKDYNNFKSFVRTKDFSKDSNYNALLEKVDIDSFIDFYAVQLYYNHFDFSYNKNVLVWKSRSKTDKPYQDSKWRWMLYDFDYAAVNRDVTKTSGGENITIRYDYAYNTFTGVNLFAGDFKNDIFFHSFMNNKDFKEKFVNRFMDLANTTLSGDTVYQKQYDEFGMKSTSLNTFFDNRFEYISKYLAEYIGINPNTVNVNIITNKNIIFNSLNINNNFEGKYFQKHYLNLNTNGNKYILTDLNIVKLSESYLLLEITGKNPTIEIV